MIEIISVKKVAEKFGVLESWVQKLCEENRIDGVIRFGCSWTIPKDAKKPVDGRLK